MPIITLTTDFGLKDHFVGVLKGSIYSELPDINIVDISHNVTPFNIHECAYLIQNSYHSFPKGSIHIIGVDSEATIENKHIAVLVDGHYFISANTGVVGLITSELKPEKVVEINIPNPIHGSFPVLSIFIQVACHLARGGTLEVVGKPFDALTSLREFAPRIANEGKKIVGSVIYIDNYGNVVTNIKKHLFDAYRNGKDFELQVRGKKLRKIFNTYSQIIDFTIDKEQRQIEGELLALFNSSGYIELAIYRSNLNTVGGASTLLGLEYRDTVILEFI